MKRKHPGGVPEWPKGADCKSAGSAFDGSNPSPSTIFSRKEKPLIDALGKRQLSLFKIEKKNTLEGFPSGQREQTVNLPAPPSMVRIRPPPPYSLVRETLD